MNIKKRHKLFNNPTREYRGKPFWSWNGKLEEKELIRQIDVMIEMGFGGFFMHSRTGLETEYLGDEWFELTNKCADYGSANDMESWLYDEDRWPSGTAGGIVTKEEKYRAMFLTMDILSYEDISSFNWNESIVAVFACQLQNVYYSNSRKFAKGDTLDKTESLVVFYTRYPECHDVYNGCTYLDTLNKEAVKKYIEVTHDRYVEECGERIGTSIQGIFTDEPHRGPLFSEFSHGRENAVPYTPLLFEEFKKKFGYDLRFSLLDLFLIKEGQELSKVTRDYIELCQELFIKNFAIPIQDWCHKHNMILTGHVLHEDSLTAQTVMQGSLMRFYEYMDYPGIDHLTEHNECWWIAKQVDSVAKQLDRPWILSELNGCTGWQMNLESYKHIGDWQALFGVNLRCPHLSWYTMKGEAKRDYPASILHQSPWYEEYKYLEDYYSRIHVLLAEGKPERDLLVLNPIESVWARSYSGAFDGLVSRNENINNLEKRYEEVFNRLVRNRIDFDYGEEDILARHARVENGTLIVGKSTYKKILVSGMETMRSSTLNLLREFVNQGGELIFAGEVPKYVDVLPSSEVEELGKRSIVMAFEDAFEKACASGNEVIIKGEASKDIFAQTRICQDMKVVFLLNINRKQSYKNVEICIGKGKKVELWDAKDGTRTDLSYNEKDGNLYLNIDFAKAEEKLIVILDDENIEQASSGCKVVNDEGKKDSSKLVQRDYSQTRYKYSLSEKNIYVIDMVEVTIDKGQKINKQEVLKADRSLRDILDIPYRSGEMLQPWFEKKLKGKEEKLCEVSLVYDFKTDREVEDIQLVVEDLEHISSIYLNGKEISRESTGKWIDICFHIISLPNEIKKGKNVIEIQYDYYKTCGLEAIYLLGDFGVNISKDNSDPVITTLPEHIEIGDITYQGLPFYSGKISYHIEGLEDKHLLVRVNNFKGSCVKLIGEEEKIIAFDPYESEIKGLKTIQVVLTRRNTFGPLHQIPATAPYYAPDSYMTTNENWSDNYVLLPHGLIEEPEYFEL